MVSAVGEISEVGDLNCAECGFREFGFEIDGANFGVWAMQHHDRITLP
jgi:hypothetical protein